MTSRDLAGCCGIRVIYDFGSTQHSMCNKDFSLEYITSEMDNHEALYNHPMFLVTLNHEQYNKFNDFVIARGYRLIEKGYHASHNSVIYIYLKINPKVDNSKVAIIEKELKKQKEKECIPSLQ